jgi:ABC-2 type transport system permease protein
MRGALAIARKDLAVAFTTPLAWVALVLVAFLAALYFNSYLGAYVSQVMQGLPSQRPELLARANPTDMVVVPGLASLGVFLMLASPLLTMRLLAEEKGRRTFELLMTAPVRPSAVVAGKFLAALGLVVVILAVGGIFPAALAVVGRGGEHPVLEWQTVATCFLGLLLLGAMCQAVGLFVSSLTDSMAVAALVSFIVMLLLLLLPRAALASQGALREVVAVLSTPEHMTSFLEGRLELKDVLYFLSVTALGLYLTERVIEGHRWA